jgi:hypothetical protein
VFEMLAGPEDGALPELAGLYELLLFRLSVELMDNFLMLWLSDDFEMRSSSFSVSH